MLHLRAAMYDLIVWHWLLLRLITPLLSFVDVLQIILFVICVSFKHKVLRLECCIATTALAPRLGCTKQ